MAEQNKRVVGTKQSPEYIKKLIAEEATRQGVPVELALAVAQHESNFNNVAVSKTNSDGSKDHGVFQLNDKYHKLNNVYDPVENIQYGIGMLRAGLAKNNGDVRKTLSDYNAGPNAVGKGRRQGDAYALKVMNIMNKTKPEEIIKIAASSPMPEPTVDQMTGAAAPADDNIGDTAKAIGQSYSQMGEDIKRKYIDPAQYEALMAESLRNRQRAEAQEAYDRMKQVPTRASAEELAKINEQYNQAQANLNAGYNQARADIQAGMGANRVNDYYNMLMNADAKRLQEMQAANPYTRMAQMAPVDANTLAREQATNRFRNMMGITQPVNFAQEQRAVEMARQSGLTPEEFIQAGLMDYNRMGETYNNQQQVLNNMIQHAYAGDRQAQQILANMGINEATARNILLQNQAAAQQNADANALNNAKYQAELEKFRAGAGQTLDPQTLAAANAFNLNKFNQGINTVNTNVGYGANAAQAFLTNAMRAQQAQQASDVVDPYNAYMTTQKQVGNIMMGNPNVTAQDIQNFQTGLQQATVARYPETAPYFTGNYSQFSPANINTFNPNQKK